MDDSRSDPSGASETTRYTTRSLRSAFNVNGLAEPFLYVTLRRV